MPVHDRRARSGALLGWPVLFGALIVVLVTTSVLASQLVSDGDASASVQDVAGLKSTTAGIVDLADKTAGEEGREAASTDGDDSEGATTAADDPESAKDLKAQRRLRTAVTKRSKALSKLVALAEKKAKRDEAAANAPFSLTIGSFNVLGSQHTAPGGDRRNFPPASVRSAGAVNRLADHGVDIVGMQELQDDQLRTIQARTGFAAYPGFQWGTAETDNSILYDDSRFEFVSGDRFTIPFMGRPRPQPIVRLRERTTGREFYVVNTHPSAHGGRYLTERRQGQAALVGVVNNLKQSGLPVLVTGDMNDRELFYCNVVPQAGLSASNGGSYSSGCRPPPGSIPVDWVVGSGVSWSNYRRDTTPVTSRISDHFFISAVASIG